MNLKYAAMASLLGPILSLYASYFHMHISSFTNSHNKKFKCLSYHHLSLFFGLSSISWCGHLIHISLPPNLMLDEGIDPTIIPCPQDLLFKDYQEIILPTLSTRPFVNFYCYLKSTSLISSTGKLLNSSTSNVFLAQVTAHHFYLGIVFITSSITALRVRLRIANVLHLNSWDAQLSMNLAIAASLSIAFAHHIYAIPIYPYCASDYPTVLSIDC